MTKSKKLWGYSLHSVKGGVGRSTLALQLARHLSATCSHMPVYLLDMDLTGGTSLVDQLPLQAPGLSIQQTQDYLESRAKGGSHTTLFMNDYLLYSPPSWEESADLKPQALCWGLGEFPNLRVFPSSPLPMDVEAVQPVINAEYYSGFLEGRCEALLEALLQDEEEIAVVMDTPPAMIGVSRALLSLGLRLRMHEPLAEGGRLSASLESAACSWIAALVTTPDDFCTAQRWHKLTQPAEQDALRIVVNRAPCPQQGLWVLDVPGLRRFDDCPSLMSGIWSFPKPPH